jgi:hypothetical protein
MDLGKCIETAVQPFIEIIQEALDKGLDNTLHIWPPVSINLC